MSTTSYEMEEKLIIDLRIEYTLVNMPSEGLITEDFMRRVIPHEVALTSNSVILNAPVKRGGLKLESLKVKRVQSIKKK